MTEGEEIVLRHKRLQSWVVVAALLVGIVGVASAWMIYGWMTKSNLLHTMMSEGSYSLKNDAPTKSQVNAVLPQLLDIHRQAVVDCGNAKMADLTRMDAFNRRIKSWHAILMAMELTGDQSAADYVETFVNSNRATPEEVLHGKNSLRRVRPTGY